MSQSTSTDYTSQKKVRSPFKISSLTAHILLDQLLVAALEDRVKCLTDTESLFKLEMLSLILGCQTNLRDFSVSLLQLLVMIERLSKTGSSDGIVFLPLLLIIIYSAVKLSTTAEEPIGTLRPIHDSWLNTLLARVFRDASSRCPSFSIW